MEGRWCKRAAIAQRERWFSDVSRGVWADARGHPVRHLRPSVAAGARGVACGCSPCGDRPADDCSSVEGLLRARGELPTRPHALPRSPHARRPLRDKPAVLDGEPLARLARAPPTRGDLPARRVRTPHLQGRRPLRQPPDRHPFTSAPLDRLPRHSSGRHVTAINYALWMSLTDRLRAWLFIPTTSDHDV